MTRPLLCLAMIVRDEADSLPGTLRSVASVVDAVAIVDTGSLDATAAVALRHTEHLAGCVSTAEFVDFAQARNVALDRAEETGAEWILMLSGDELLAHGEAVRAFCRGDDAARDGAHYLRCRQEAFVYDSARLIRGGGGWRYVGATHEVLRGPRGEQRPSAVVRVPGAEVRHRSGPRKAWMARWTRNVELLTAMAQRDPGEPRWLLYLAQTLAHLGQHREAMATYQRRVDAGGWEEERWEAMMGVAREAERAHPHAAESVADAAYLAAMEAAPDRAEPLAALARRALADGQPESARLFAERGAALAFPEAAHHMVLVDCYGPDGKCAKILRRIAAG